MRIALNLKGLDYKVVPVSLIQEGGQHRADSYRKLNPQGLVPFFEDDDVAIGQSQAILEYLEDVYPEPALLPESPRDRARVRQIMNIVCCDIHPLNNLRVLDYLDKSYSAADVQKGLWYFEWISKGFQAIEALLEREGEAQTYCFGDAVTFADVCLIPQVYNALRYDVPINSFRNILRVADNCNALESFQMAAPENQRDAQ